MNGDTAYWLFVGYNVCGCALVILFVVCVAERELFEDGLEWIAFCLGIIWVLWPLFAWLFAQDAWEGWRAQRRAMAEHRLEQERSRHASE